MQDESRYVATPIRDSEKSGSSTKGNRVFALDRNGKGEEEFAFSTNITKKGDRG